MINKIWFFLVIGGVIFSLFTGRSEILSKEIFENSINAVKFIFDISGGILFWSGILRIIEKANLTERLEKIFSPIGRLLFKDIYNKGVAYKYIILCLVSNFLGLGNAATPIGIRAMEELQKINKNKLNATKEMKVFVLLNIAMFQLLPTMLINVRTVAGSAAPYAIIAPVWIVTGIIFVVSIFISKFLR